MEIQYKILSYSVSVFFVLLIFAILRKRKLKENLSLIWLGFATIIILITLFFHRFEALAVRMGIDDPNNLVFFSAIVFLIFFCIILSTEVSKASSQGKTLVQEIAILRHKIDETDIKIKVHAHNPQNTD